MYNVYSYTVQILSISPPKKDANIFKKSCFYLNILYKYLILN